MCLVSLTETPTVATENLICYKVVDIDLNNPKDWKSLFMGKVFPFNKLIKNKEKKDRVIKHSFRTDFIVQIGKGFFHSKIHKYEAEDLAKWFSFYNRPEKGFLRKVVKCIIPKGSLYYISEDKKEICSDEIIVLNSKDYVFNIRNK